MVAVPQRRARQIGHPAAPQTHAARVPKRIAQVEERVFNLHVGHLLERALAVGWAVETAVLDAQGGRAPYRGPFAVKGLVLHDRRPPEATKGRAVGSVISHAAAALPLFDIVNASTSLFWAIAAFSRMRAPSAPSRIDTIIEPGARSKSNGACVESGRAFVQSLTITPNLRAMPAGLEQVHRASAQFTHGVGEHDVGHLAGGKGRRRPGLCGRSSYRRSAHRRTRRGAGAPPRCRHGRNRSPRKAGIFQLRLREERVRARRITHLDKPQHRFGEVRTGELARRETCSA